MFDVGFVRLLHRNQPEVGTGLFEKQTTSCNELAPGKNDLGRRWRLVDILPAMCIKRVHAHFQTSQSDKESMEECVVSFSFFIFMFYHSDFLSRVTVVLLVALSRRQRRLLHPPHIDRSID
jgi:hypothetical protein